MKYYLGIDFGTSNSSVAYVCDPETGTLMRPETRVVSFVKEDGSGDPRIPSMVGLTQEGAGGLKTGWEFLDSLARLVTRSRRPRVPLMRHGASLFRSVKSDLGACRTYPFSCDPGTQLPEDAAALVFREMIRETGRANPEIEVRSVPAVITVPASLGAAARRETLAAAAKAGLATERVELIDEPIAALLHALSDTEKAGHLCGRESSRILVFDYGGGTLDLCLVECRRDPDAAFGFQVKHLAISHYLRNGGTDIDRAIMEMVLWPQVERQLRALRTQRPAGVQHAIEDTLTSFVARPLKERMCLRVERMLRDNGGNWAAIGRDIEERFASPLEFESPELPRRLKADFTLTFAAFREIMADFSTVPFGPRESWERLFPRSVLPPVFDTLGKAGVSGRDLDVLLLHGGGCRNPFVEAALRQAFGRSDLFSRVKIVRTPDLNTSVAQGAALACYWRKARGIEPVKPIIAEEVGIMDAKGSRITLVPAGQTMPFPCDREYWETPPFTFFVPQDKPPVMIVPWYTGTKRGPAHYVKLDLAAFPETRRGDEVGIRLRIDRDKVLHWQYRIAGGEPRDAEALEDPWRTSAPSPEERRLAEHRRRMRECVRASPGVPVPPDMIVTEAQLCRNAGDYETAELNCLEYLERHGDDMLVLNTLSLICSDRGRHGLAVTYGKRAMDLDPGNAILVGNYGCDLAASGRLEEGERTMLRALEMDPTLTYLHERLGDLYRQTNRRDLAAKVVARGLAVLNGDNPCRAGDTRRDAVARAVRLCRFLGREAEAREAGLKLAEIRQKETIGDDKRFIIASYRSGEGCRG